MKKAATLVAVLAILVSGCGSSSSSIEASEDAKDRQWGSEWPNSYGGINVYDPGYRSGATITVYDNDVGQLCSIDVPDKTHWPDEFDPAKVECMTE